MNQTDYWFTKPSN